jgi:hypothetical protein
VFIASDPAWVVLAFNPKKAVPLCLCGYFIVFEVPAKPVKCKDGVVYWFYDTRISGCIG